MDVARDNVLRCIWSAHAAQHTVAGAFFDFAVRCGACVLSEVCGYIWPLSWPIAIYWCHLGPFIERYTRYLALTIFSGLYRRVQQI